MAPHKLHSSMSRPEDGNTDRGLSIASTKVRVLAESSACFPDKTRLYRGMTVQGQAVAAFAAALGALKLRSL